jgi:CRP-like cAMP-binding protein
MREGEPGTEFYVVVDGQVDVRRRGRRIARLSEGSYVGEIALLSCSPRTATVVAATPLRVLVIAGRDFVELLDSLPELWLKVARTLADRVDADEAMDASRA